MEISTASVVSDMLRLFRQGATEYQPTCPDMERETGDPQASLRNLRSLKLPVQAIFQGKVGCLVTFVDGEQFYATGLSLYDEDRRAALVEYAGANGFGPIDRLAPLYESLIDDPEYGQLPVVDTGRERVPGRWQPPARS